jgi:hypothetical protein
VAAFLTTVTPTGRTATYLPVPLDIPALFEGRHRPPVVVRLKGHSFRSTVAKYGDEYVVPLNKENRAAAGVAAGDRVSVEIELDTEPRVVEPPLELAAALADNTDAREAYGALSYSHQKEFADWVGEAKRPETRRRRAAQAIDRLREGERRS